MLYESGLRANIKVSGSSGTVILDPHTLICPSPKADVSRLSKSATMNDQIEMI